MGSEPVERGKAGGWPRLKGLHRKWLEHGGRKSKPGNRTTGSCCLDYWGMGGEFIANVVVIGF